jgi:hypothetical protein
MASMRQSKAAGIDHGTIDSCDVKAAKLSQQK